MDYKIGDVGPGGGFIFYINSDNKTSWKYMETSPVDICDESVFSVGVPEELLEGFESLGSGYENTLAIVKACDGKESAAKKCIEYCQNGYSDWYLPSIYELELIFKNLQNKPGELDNRKSYWSSSKHSWDSTAQIQYGFMNTQLDQKLNQKHAVRACRRF